MSFLFLPIESHILDIDYESKNGYVLRFGSGKGSSSYAVCFKDRIEYVTDNETLAVLLLYERFLSKPKKVDHGIIRLPFLRLTRNVPIYTNGDVVIKGNFDEVELLSLDELRDYSYDIITYEWGRSSFRSENNGDKVFIINFERCDYLTQKDGTQVYECYIEDFGRYFVLYHMVSCVIAQSIDVLMKLAEYGLDVDVKVLDSLRYELWKSEEEKRELLRI
ncbi:hypothetical protein DFR86_11380 [Acidianus sulfidivorans JP7]|uniref:Uncharacterized protein n=1 Tax=Acidianus sulfidivorans JP7 TaxID=619593 RepID=A0A2U9IQ15_9CREN|nr:hypothetical protein [Acidianus sulfidivorans]AWR98076.1 hypothetical protein DFR86_11380 [Acidianus sulfidivorans JP7]